MLSFRQPSDQSTAALPQRKPSPAQTVFIESLHLFVLATFGITQPVYDRLGERPMFLSDSNVGRPAILLLTATLSLLIPGLVPLALWCVGRLAPRARAPLYAIVVYLLLSLIALPLAKRAEWLFPDWLTIGLGLAGAGVATWGYFTFRHLRSVVTAAAAGIVVFPAIFLFHSPVSTLFFTSGNIQAAAGKPIPVVMVVLDELCGMTLENDERQIDAARFPHFAELARGSTWYRNATTVFPETMQALPVLLSGKYPSLPLFPGPADLPQNLFSLLDSAGDNRLAVFEPVSRLAPKNDRSEHAMTKSWPAQIISIAPTLARVYLLHLAPTESQDRLPGIPRLWFGFHEHDQFDHNLHRGVFRYRWGRDRRGQFEHFIDCFDDSPGDSPEAALYFFHVLLPHVPWCYLPSGRRYIEESNQFELLDFDTHSGKMNFWGTDKLFVAQSQQRYLLQLQFADSLLGQTIARLRETGLFDKCLLIVTADHGISFKVSESRRGVTPGNVVDLMSVPLFIKTPGQQTGAVNDKNVESVDILPTIADVLGIKLELPVDGRSVFAAVPERTEKTIFPIVGERMAVPLSALDDRSVVQELQTRFGSSADRGGMYRIGPHPELLGRSIADLEIADAPATEIKLRRFGTRYSDDRDELVPCYFEGKVVSPRSIPEPIRMVVAINGIIQGTTRTYEFDGLRDQWAAMVPEQAFRVGENDVQFYTISGTAPDLRLTRCTINTTPPRK